MEKESDGFLTAEERIQQLTGLLLDKIARAVEELDVYTSVSRSAKKKRSLMKREKLLGKLLPKRSTAAVIGMSLTEVP